MRRSASGSRRAARAARRWAGCSATGISCATGRPVRAGGSSIRSSPRGCATSSCSARGALGGTAGEDAGDRVVLGLGDPDAVLVLDRDLAGDVAAAEGLVGREPGGGVAVALAAVG